ncbi:MAG: hypothetical protein ACRDNK_16760 [Solirubrobacteraceae bacterium]
MAHPHPLDSYGLDEQVQWGYSHIDTSFDRLCQWIIQSVWQLMLYVFAGVLLMLEWAFSLDIVHQSLNKLAGALQTMRGTVVNPWILAALAGMALWGIWNGLFRKKTIDTIRGLAVSLLCMVGVLVLIGDPVGTLGSATNTANGASMEMLGSVTGHVGQPDQGIASAEQQLFSAVILKPWCALQFGNVDYCLSKPAGLNQSVADTWLQDLPGSQWRTSLWQITGSSKQDAQSQSYAVSPPGNKNLGDVYALAGHPEKVALLGNLPGPDSSDGQSLPRLGLMLLIAVGLVGAVALFFFLAVQLLIAALFVLILVLFAPAMLLVAALGESGRLSVAAWFKRLVGAIVTKVIFALFLAVVVTGTGLISDLQLGFFATWLLFVAFWWGVLLKRADLLALLMLDYKRATPDGLTWSGAPSASLPQQWYYGRQIAGDLRRTSRRAIRIGTWAPRAAWRFGRRRV